MQRSVNYGAFTFQNHYRKKLYPGYLQYNVRVDFYSLINTILLAPTFGNVIGSFALTFFSRALASKRKNPVTVYLISGIFPLVPGAGIYYTSYYLIMNDMVSFSQAGLSTIKTAGAIVMGIILGMAFPQSFFNTAFAPSGRK